MEILKYLLTASLLSFLGTPLTIKLAKKFDVVDDPKKHRHPKVIHTYPVPRGGGFPLYVSILISSLLFLPLDYHLKLIIAGASFIVLIGLLDDKYNLNPYLRIALQLITLLIPAAGGIGINFIANPLGGLIHLDKFVFNLNYGEISLNIKPLVIFFTVFWALFIMNMVNMGAKGVDGQLPGVIVVAASTIAVLSLRFSADITQWPIIILATITAGAYLGFLPWSFYPQKIMPSYSGSTLGGYMLAILSILSTAKVGTLLVVLGIPIIDTAFVITRRILSGKSPVWGDRTHLHHKLLDKGWSKAQVALFYWFTTLVLGMLALILNSTLKVYTIIGIILFLMGLSFWTKEKNNGNNN